LIRNLGFKPIHPGFQGPGTCRPQDLVEPDTNHGCYNFAIPVAALAGLRGNGLGWGQHGYLEPGDIYIQSSPHTLWLPGLWYYHFSVHPRSPLRQPGNGNWVRPVQDLGSVPVRPHIHPPEVLFRPDGPENPTLAGWGLRGTRSNRGRRSAVQGV
jgi:hypothetical protein